MDMTVLLPCLDEEATVGGCVLEARRFLLDAGLSGEVLVADNASVDGSAAEAIHAGARVLPVRQRGYGAALLAGIANARGRYVAMGDADGTYRFADLAAFLPLLDKGFDLVVGNRFVGGVMAGAMPLSHRLGAPVLSFLARLRFGSGIRDFHCGLRAFRKTSILGLGLKSPGMEFATEMIARAGQAGLAICETPCRLFPCPVPRTPRLHTVRDGLRHLDYIVSQ